MFGTYEPTARRSDWDKYYGDPEHYQYGYGTEVYRGEGKGRMYDEDFHRRKLHKKLEKMDKKERKKYLKKHGLYTPESYEKMYYRPHHETYLSKEERMHPHYRTMHMEEYPREKFMYGGMGKEMKYGDERHHEMYGKKFKKQLHGMEGVHFKRDKEGRKKWKAVCDMGESEKYWIVRAELPGVRKEKLRVEMEGKDLVIIGKKKKELWHMDKLGIRQKEGEKKTDVGKTSSDVGSTQKMKEKGGESLKGIKWWRKERGLKGNFKRRIHLPKKVDHSAIEALYKDGILEVLIKKPEGLDKKPVEGHTIPIH